MYARHLVARPFSCGGRSRRPSVQSAFCLKVVPQARRGLIGAREMNVKCLLVHKRFERWCWYWYWYWYWCQWSGRSPSPSSTLVFVLRAAAAIVGEDKPPVIASSTSERSESVLLPLLRSASPNQEVSTLGGTLSSSSLSGDPSVCGARRSASRVARDVYYGGFCMACGSVRRASH